MSRARLVAGATLVGLSSAAMLWWLATRPPSKLVDSGAPWQALIEPAVSPLRAVALGLLAAWAAGWISKGWLRFSAVLTGLVLAILACYLSWSWPSTFSADLVQQARELGVTSPVVSPLPVRWWLRAVAGLSLVCWLVAISTFRSWPTMSPKYDKPGVANQPQPVNSELDLWRALDQGQDPTLGDRGLN